MTLTPASPDSLPPLGQLIADEPFWKYPIGAAGEGIAHLRICPGQCMTHCHNVYHDQSGMRASSGYIT
jgi:hypothetical protein